jgi:hypothetical protein
MEQLTKKESDKYNNFKGRLNDLNKNENLIVAWKSSSLKL